MMAPAKIHSALQKSQNSSMRKRSNSKRLSGEQMTGSKPASAPPMSRITCCCSISQPGTLHSLAAKMSWRTSLLISLEMCLHWHQRRCTFLIPSDTPPPPPPPITISPPPPISCFSSHAADAGKSGAVLKHVAFQFGKKERKKTSLKPPGFMVLSSVLLRVEGWKGGRVEGSGSSKPWNGQWLTLALGLFLELWYKVCAEA